MLGYSREKNGSNNKENVQTKIKNRETQVKIYGLENNRVLLLRSEYK